MEADQHPNSNGRSPPPPTQKESVTPEELHKERTPSRNPLKWFKNAGASAPAGDSRKSSGSSKSSSSSNSKEKPPLVVHYFPTGGRPGLS